MPGPGSLLLCVLAAGLVLAGTARALRGAGSRRFTLVARAGTVLLGLGSLAGLARYPVPVREGATHPERPKLALRAPFGGEGVGRVIGRRWEAIGMDDDSVRLLGPDEICGRFPKLPLVCAARERLSPAAFEAVRLSGEEIGATDLTAQCPMPEVSGMLVTNRLDDVRNVTMGAGESKSVNIFTRPFTLGLDLKDPRQAIVVLTSADGSTARVPALSGSVPIRVAVGGAGVQLRASASQDASNQWHVTLFDQRVVCQ